jgi:predicted dehydrogenase
MENPYGGSIIMLNVAIIGTGNISPAHINAYLKFPERCRIVALVDIIPEKARDKNERFSLNAEVYDSHKSILDREDIDLVSICTPPYTHASIAIDFLKNNKHVIVEKPMASSLEECDAMLEAAKTHNKVLSVIAQNRFKNPVYRLKHILESNKLGRVLHAQVDSLWWRGYAYYDLWWRGSWEKEGGGPTLNHAVHHIDMLCWMIGLPEEVLAFLSNVAHDNAEVEDLSVSILKYPQGTLGQITSSVVHHGEEQKLIFQCENAKVSVPWSLYASKSLGSGFPQRDEELERLIQEEYDKIPDLKYEGHVGQIDDVMTAIENNGKPLIKGVDGRRTLELITAIYKSGCTNQHVKLPLDKEDPFYTVEGILKNAKYFYEKKTSILNLDSKGVNLGSDYR